MHVLAANIQEAKSEHGSAKLALIDGWDWPDIDV